jgi:Chaperone of endosialidase
MQRYCLVAPCWLNIDESHNSAKFYKHNLEAVVLAHRNISSTYFARILCFCAALSLIALSASDAQAQETQPGDACTGGELNFSRWTAGPENTGVGNFIVCNGTVWVPVFQYSSSGLIGINTATPSTVTMSLGGTDALKLTSGTTAQRPSLPANGMIRYNTTTNKLEAYEAAAWTNMIVAGGTQTFTALTDAPSSYTGSGGYFVRVNSGATSLEFTNQVISSLTGQPAPSAIDLDDLSSVSIASAIAGDVLTYNGTNWIRSGAYTGSVLVPSGTNAQRPGSAVGGMFRYNTTATPSDVLEYFDAETAAWIQLPSSSGGGSIDALTDGISNTTSTLFLGTSSGVTNTGTGNTGVGINSMASNVAKQENTAIGLDAMRYANSSVTTGITFNTALGAYALRGSTTASANTGTSNTAIGHSALLAITSGSNNIALGALADDALTSGSNNITIGYNIDAVSATGSNQLNIGNTIYGDLANAYIGIGNNAPSVALDVTGDIEYTGTINDISDQRLKKNIVLLSNKGSMVNKLSAINSYSFVMKDDPLEKIEFGILAQDLEKVFPELVKTADDEIGTKSVNYMGIIPALMQAIKEQQAQIDDLKAQVKILSER